MAILAPCPDCMNPEPECICVLDGCSLNAPQTREIEETCSQCNSTANLRRSPLGDLHCVACIRRDGVDPETWEESETVCRIVIGDTDAPLIRDAEGYWLLEPRGEVGPFVSEADARETYWNANVPDEHRISLFRPATY